LSDFKECKSTKKLYICTVIILIKIQNGMQKQKVYLLVMETFPI
jgi:hypothetical protein